MNLEPEHFLRFYDAAWELCRIGVLRPGHYAPMGQGQIGSGQFSGDGYSITEFGHAWLAKADRRVAGDPSRMAYLFASFANAYGPGFAQRADEAVRCHRTSNFLAACVMAGAAAESILLAVAIAKTGDELQSPERLCERWRTRARHQADTFGRKRDRLREPSMQHFKFSIIGGTMRPTEWQPPSPKWKHMQV